MKDIFRQLIVDFQKQELPRPTSREFAPLVIPEPLRKARVLVGMRRSGKTWSLYCEMHRLLEEGINRSQIVYLNFEDDRLLGCTVKDLQSLLEAYFELYPEHARSSTLYFFFDEIHEVPMWERFIRRLLDQEEMQLYITGSSAKMLSKEIATSLRGRTLVTEVYPYSFSEYLDHLRVKWPTQPSTKQIAELNHHLQDFITWGGFPEVVGLTPQLHREILQSYIDTVIYRDIIERYGVTNAEVLRKLLAYCLQNPASLFSINKTYHTLKSQGYSVSKNTLYTFMDYFEDAYCIFSIGAFHFSSKKAALRPRKIYPVDQGLITAYAIDTNMQLGPSLEALVFSALKRSSAELHYYITSKGYEVDFFARFPDQSRKLIQVSLSIRDPATKEREVKALVAAMEECHLQRSLIVTLDESDTIENSAGTIQVVSLRDFLAR